jgi:hypothetical protein
LGRREKTRKCGVRTTEAGSDSFGPQNPRLPDGTSNDKEAINRLLAEGYSQLLALARNLTERGEANPTELPIVLQLYDDENGEVADRLDAAIQLTADALRTASEA